MKRLTTMIYTHVILICELFLKGSINYFDQQTRISSSFRILILSKSCYCYCYSIVFCKVFILHLSFYILACKLVKIKITYDKVFLNILKEQNFYKTIDMKWFVLGWNSELSMNSGHLLAGGEFLCKMLYLIWKYTYTKFNQPLKIKRQNSFIYLFLHSLNCTCYKIPSITNQIKYQAKIKYPTFKRRTITLKKTQANQ